MMARPAGCWKKKLQGSMDGGSMNVAAQAALETLSRGADGELLERPAIRSDNGSGYVSREFCGPVPRRPGSASRGPAGEASPRPTPAAGEKNLQLRQPTLPFVDEEIRA